MMRRGGAHFEDYPPIMDTSTLPDDGMAGQMQLSPDSGPIGTSVTISGPVIFDGTNTIFMNGFVAAKEVAPDSDGNLTFTIPENLAPDCQTGQACPQFLMKPSPNAYDISVRGLDGMVSAGIFTVTSK
jgi:hypothetical protein